MNNKNTIPHEYAAPPVDWFRLCLIPHWWLTIGNYGMHLSLGRSFSCGISRSWEWIITQTDHGGWIVTQWGCLFINQWSNESFQRHLADMEHE